MSNLDDNWWQWRRNKDADDRERDNRIAADGTRIAVLETRQQIMEDNQEARHAKTPQTVYWVVSGVISLAALLLQLWAMGGRVTP